VTEIHADIEALKEFHEALVRFRYAQRDVAERGGDAIEMTRASLAAKASRGQARLEQCQADLDACRAGGGPSGGQGGGPSGVQGGGTSSGRGGGQEEAAPDCSAYVRAVEQATGQLEHIRRWQQRVDAEAGEFAGTAGGFLDLLETDLPRAESQLLAAIASLEAARRVQAGGS
jgi:hypothetical protein